MLHPRLHWVQKAPRWVGSLLTACGCRNVRYELFDRLRNQKSQFRGWLTICGGSVRQGCTNTLSQV